MIVWNVPKNLVQKTEYNQTEQESVLFDIILKLDTLEVLG